MTERKVKTQELNQFEWKPTAGAPRIYANYFHLGWTLDDLRITFGALRGKDVSGTEFFAEEQGSLVITWRQAKNLRDMLTRVVASYEERNGEIQTPLLAITPTPKAE